MTTHMLFLVVRTLLLACIAAAFVGCSFSGASAEDGGKANANPSERDQKAAGSSRKPEYASTDKADSTGGAQQPNVLFIMTDDQQPSSLEHMPIVQKRLVSGGRVFENSLFTTPLCCPSRATAQTGKYTHNHRVLSNSGEFGGYKEFRENKQDLATAATALDAAGYDTGYFGKYMNSYDGKSVPIGWDHWFAKVQGEPYMARDSSQKDWVPIPKTSLPSGDGMAQEAALSFLRDREKADAEAPFFIQIGFFAPHRPADYQKQYGDMFEGERVPRTPAYDEDCSDKPTCLPPLTSKEKQISDATYRDKLRAVQHVDVFVGQLLDELARQGELDRTYIFFQTDNSVHMGEYRLDYGKSNPYQTDVNFPLIAKGPTIVAGQDKRLVGNQDLAPTFASLGGASMPEADGRPLLPLFSGEYLPWRKVLLAEAFDGKEGRRHWGMVWDGKSAYIERKGLADEYYDLKRDPYQIDNAYARLGEKKQEALHEKLLELKSCEKEACRIAEMTSAVDSATNATANTITDSTASASPFSKGDDPLSD